MELLGRRVGFVTIGSCLLLFGPTKLLTANEPFCMGICLADVGQVDCFQGGCWVCPAAGSATTSGQIVPAALKHRTAQRYSV